MMRNGTLRRLANNQLLNDNRGSHRDKKYRHFVIHKVIHDLFHLQRLPGKWHGLNQDHIIFLVAYWKKKQIKPSTIMKYMTVIRYFLKGINHNIDGIDNPTLGLVKPKPKTEQTSKLINIVERLSHPIAKIIFLFQTEFGLTFSEATRLIADIHIREHSLWITREIAFNHQDRITPIRHDNQLNWYNHSQYWSALIIVSLRLMVIMLYNISIVDQCKTPISIH